MNMRSFVESLTYEERQELSKSLQDKKVLDEGGLTAEEMKMSTIEAIRSVRNRTGLGLVFAKELVERGKKQ